MIIRRSIRGGSYYIISWNLRTSVMYNYMPEDRFGFVGIRIVVKRRKR